MGPEAARLQRMVRGAQKSLEGWEVWTREQRCGDRLGGPGTTCSLQEGAGDNGLEGPVGLTSAASLGFWSRGQASGLASGAGSLLRGRGLCLHPAGKGISPAWHLVPGPARLGVDGLWRQASLLTAPAGASQQELLIQDQVGWCLPRLGLQTAALEQLQGRET